MQNALIINTHRVPKQRPIFCLLQVRHESTDFDNMADMLPRK